MSLNMVYAKDDPSSIRNSVIRIIPAHALDSDASVLVPPDTLRMSAAEGVVASLSGRAVVVAGVELSGEAAISSYTSDQSSMVVELKDNPLRSILTTRASTRADFGGKAALSVSLETWGVTLSARYLGAGFVPIGYAFGQADRFELAVAPFLNLFDSKLAIKGSIGQRVNNLSNNSGETSRHLIGSASINATISDAVTVSAQYSNYGVRNDQASDTLKVQNVNQSVSIDPTFTWQAIGAQHSLTTSLALDKYDDYNVVTGTQSSNDTRTALAAYNAGFDSIPLNLGLIASYLENRLFTGALIVRSIGLTGSYMLFDGAIEPRVSVTLGSSTLGSMKTDDQVFLKAGLRFRAGRLFSAAIDIGSNRYDYGESLPRGDSFDESLLQLSLTSQF